VKELYINGILCDLSEKDNPIALSYEVNNLAELKDRQAFTTNNFKLPLTQNNRRACGFPDTGSIIGLQPYRKNTCKIVQDGIEILTNGIALITSCKDFISVQALSGLIGFFDLLEGKSIRDLDLSAYEHTWDLATIVASQANTDGYTWSVIDYGSISETERSVNVKQLRPATFRKTIIQKIIAEAGYSVQGEPTDIRYTKSTIPFSNDKFEHGQSFINAANTFSASAKTLVDQEFSNDVRDGVASFPDDFTTDPGNHWSGTEYTAPATMKAKVRMAPYTIMVRDQYKGGSTPYIVVRIEKWNGSTWSTVAENQHIAGQEFTDIVYADQVLEADVDLEAGDKIRIAWHNDPDTQRIVGHLYPGAQVSITYQPTEVIFGQPVQLEATLPDISQKDFFKDFLQNFGLIVVPDNYRKHIRLVNMEEVYYNKYQALDWTEKFTDSPPDIDYSFGSYGINNYGNYKKDNAVPDATGRGVMVFDNQTLKTDVDLFTSKFAASVSVMKMSGVSVAQIKKIEDALTSLEFKTKTEPRILVDEKVNTTIIFTDGANTQSANTISLPYFTATGKSGLSYQELFDEHYPEILRMLYRPFVMNRNILLKPTDLQTLDFTLPIFDKNTGAYYYNNGVFDYIAGEECKISLVKLQ
jgi:hypothetical protein